MSLTILQLGNGRWGQNHKRILKGFGHRVETHDIDENYWEVLSKNKGRINAVIVTASSVNHWPIARMCINMGIPVFTEKPVLLKRHQLEELKLVANKKLIMGGHQLIFMPEVVEAQEKGCRYMNSMRSGAIPRTEGSLFSLMVHDIAMAHYVTGAKSFTCTWAEGNRHEIKATLKSNQGIVDLYAVSISKVRLRHTTFITPSKIIHMTPNNWERIDLLYLELKTFCAYVEKGQPIEVNGAMEIINVMSTIFKIEEKLEKSK